MSAHPIDVIANAIRTADGNHTMGAGQLAEVAAKAIATDERFVDNAVAELTCHMRVTSRLDEAEIRFIATAVLRSVAGE